MTVRPRKTLTLALVSALAVAGLTTGASGASASADLICPIQTGGSYFGTIEANPNVNMRCSPGGTISDHAYYGDLVRVVCWATGPVETGWGGTNDYWDYLYDYDTESSGAFVADVWVNTGGPVTNVVPEC